MNYLDLLEHSYEQTKQDRVDASLGRLEFLAEDIFGITTYENIISSLMAQKILEVCKAITDRSTFEYIKSPEGNLWYLILVNLPFFHDKLSWGTSIRGAFWDFGITKNKFTIKTCGVYEGYEQIHEISFDKEQWPKFIDDMIAFARI